MFSDLGGCWGDEVTDCDIMLDILFFDAAKLQFEQFFRTDKWS
jgi:hypothetical protein